MFKSTAVNKFWSKVSKADGCWGWSGASTNSGYGVHYSGERTVCAHRFSWELANGPIPPGMEVDHICFTRTCVNPDHLRLATHKQNSQSRRGASRTNRSSGVRGVYAHGKGWMAMVQSDGKKHYLGTFSTVAEAESAVIEGRASLHHFKS